MCFSNLNCLSALHPGFSFGIVEYCSLGGEEVKEIEANLCFAIFDKNLKIQNGRHFRGGEIFFLNCQEYNAEIPVGRKF